MSSGINNGVARFERDWPGFRVRGQVPVPRRSKEVTGVTAFATLRHEG